MATQSPLHLVLSSVQEPLFSGEAVSVTVPGTEGEMTILAGHEAFVSVLKKGTVTVRTTTGEQTFEITGGVLEVSNNQAIILV